MKSILYPWKLKGKYPDTNFNGTFCSFVILSLVKKQMSMTRKYQNHQGRSYVSAKTYSRILLDQNYGKIISQFCWIIDVTCKKRVRRTKINLSKSNCDSICDDVGINSSLAPNN